MPAPITLCYASLNALIFIFLSFAVICVRYKNGIALGDGGNSKVLKAVRVHGNAAEYIPITLILMFLLETSGSSPNLIHGLGIGLTAGRVFHAFGLTRSQGPSIGRFLGVIFTFFTIVVAAVCGLMKCL